MSDSMRVGAIAYSKIHLGKTVDSKRSQINPPSKQQQAQKEQQPTQQPQPQPQQPREIPPKPLTKGQIRASEQRSTSSSPEKFRPYRGVPTVKLQSKPHVDTSGWDHSVAIDSRPRGLAAPILLRNNGSDGFDARTDEIEKRLTGVRFVEQAAVLSFSNAHLRAPSRNPPFSEHGSPYTENSYQNQNFSSPETSPMNVSLNSNFTSAATDPVIDDQFEVQFPHYASFFRPRLSPVVSIENLTINSPVPKFRGIEQAMAAEKTLKKFHMGVLLADKRSGGDQKKWWTALRSVVREHMTGLSNLGVHPHQIVFYYHGRGDIRVGNDVWDAIKAWQWVQTSLQRANSWSSGSGDNHKQEVVQESKYEDLERQARRREQELLMQKELEREKTRLTSNQKARTKWNNFAKLEGLKSSMLDGTASRLEKIYEDDDEDDSKTTW